MAAGGLFICGTERHESQADRQSAAWARRPAGRSGRVAVLPVGRGHLVQAVRGRSHLPDPRQIGGRRRATATRNRSRRGCCRRDRESAEEGGGQNFLQRKHVLEYDDVANEQRRVIYAYRDEVLEGKSIGEEARREVVEHDRAHDRAVHARGLRGGLGSRRPVHGTQPVLPARPLRRGPRPREDRPDLVDRPHERAGDRAL